MSLSVVFWIKFWINVLLLSNECFLCGDTKLNDVFSSIAMNIVGVVGIIGVEVVSLKSDIYYKLYIIYYILYIIYYIL